MSQLPRLGAAALSGLLFALGLGISGMTRPDKVLGFLDPLQGWDPSLALVMVGAIGVHLALYRWIVQRPSPLLAERFGIPTRRDINPRLVGGSALFGVGWAIGGYCPGPGIVATTSGAAGPLYFVGGMVLGMAAFHAAHRALEQRRSGLGGLAGSEPSS